MNVHVTLRVSLTSRQAHWSRSFIRFPPIILSHSQLQGVSLASDTTSTMVEYVGLDHCRPHVFVSNS